ncbi:Hypothetical predicted protein, partial [Pelobates cultripes]
KRAEKCATKPGPTWAFLPGALFQSAVWPPDTSDTYIPHEYHQVSDPTAMGRRTQRTQANMNRNTQDIGTMLQCPAAPKIAAGSDHEAGSTCSNTHMEQPLAPQESASVLLTAT